MIDEVIKNHQVLIFAGTGGVGKTTTSAAVGMRAAELGFKTLVLTIDPARRLVSALGLKELNQTTKVAEFGKGEMFASMIDYKSVFDDFVRSVSSNEKVAERVLRNPLYKQLSTNLAGSQEYTSLERLYRAVEEEGFEKIILDTPPSQHAVDFLKAPQKIYALFDSSIFKWFISKGGNDPNFVQKLFQKGTRMALKQLEVLTGTDFIENLADFFESIEELSQSIRERSASVQNLLSSKRTAFVLVTSFDETKLEEASGFNSLLKKYGYRVAMTIVNRAFPFQKESGVRVERGEIERLYNQLVSYYEDRLELAKSLRDSQGGERATLFVPDLPFELNDLSELGIMKERIVNG